MHILFYGESPFASTGLAQITRNIVYPLLEKGYTFDVVGVNHYYEHEQFVPGCTFHKIDANGDCSNEDKVVELLKEGNYDCYFHSADFGRYTKALDAFIEQKQKRDFFGVCYMPVDCEMHFVHSTFDCLEWFNVVCTYSYHSKSMLLQAKPHLHVNVIYLACETDTFFPLTREQRRAARKQYFGIDDDEYFLVLSINRNQPRKDLARLIACYHEWKKRLPHTGKLYMHCKQSDVGGSVPTQAYVLGAFEECIYTDPQYSVLEGFSVEQMNDIYNCGDVLLSCTTGEGFGLSTVEAMCAGTPVCVPRNTSQIELVGEDQQRGYLTKSGGDIDHMTWLYGISDNPREIVHSESVIERLTHIYHNREEATYKAAIARRFCSAYSRERIANQWIALFKFLEREKVA
jgi:glycosyltransferase involved in cell wall biosynthesis